MDVSNAATDILTRQNHAIFGRRGCGKSLLLHYSTRAVPPEIKTIYLNCEDFKNHSFPNVLIEILDSIFSELERHVSWWFSRKQKCKALLKDIRTNLEKMKSKADEISEKIRESTSTEHKTDLSSEGSLFDEMINLTATDSASTRAAIEREYQRTDSKIHQLNLWIPSLKRQIKEVFELSTTVKSVFIQLDDLYHLPRTVQPHIVDYLHRLCKDVPLYFKIATLRHASVLYAERQGQPTGAQERHDYQSINVDFTFQDFRKTESQIRKIFHEFAKLAGITTTEFDSLFKGDGFRRLVLAGGGVPRDCLSQFLEVLDKASADDGRIGKDDVREMSLSNLERRIEELKKDSIQSEQDSLLRGIYVLRQFCINKKSNVFLISERLLQQQDKIRQLLNRLMDYRIIHNLGSAYTHKSHQGPFQGFMIDIGAYAHMRRLHGRMVEIDISDPAAQEQIRGGPIVDEQSLLNLWRTAPANVESVLMDPEANSPDDGSPPSQLPQPEQEKM